MSAPFPLPRPAVGPPLPRAGRPAPPRPNRAWTAAVVFAAKAAARGGIVRRAVRDVEREIGRDACSAEVRRRGFHLVECGGQFIVIRNPGRLTLIC